MISSGWSIRDDIKSPGTNYCFDIFPDREGNIGKVGLSLRAVGPDLNPLLQNRL